MSPSAELVLYGILRLKRIVKFLSGRCRREDLREGYWELFGPLAWITDTPRFLSGKHGLIRKISDCGAFQYVEDKYDRNWNRLIFELISNVRVLRGFCGLFGIKVVGNYENHMYLCRNILHKLSKIFVFPGDSLHPLDRKQMNDIRFSSLMRGNFYGRESRTIAREIESFDVSIHDPLLRRIFWSNYVPGTGAFRVSFSELDHFESAEECCSICLQEFSPEHAGAMLSPCRHSLHVQCLGEVD